MLTLTQPYTHEDFKVIFTFCKDHLWLEKSDTRVKLWTNSMYLLSLLLDCAN
jgi:hypothetical protein